MNNKQNILVSTIPITTKVIEIENQKTTLCVLKQITVNIPFSFSDLDENEINNGKEILESIIYDSSRWLLGYLNGKLFIYRTIRF